MILDIIQNITDYCRLRDQITCTKITSLTNENLYIYEVDTEFKKINQKIVEQKKFSKLKILKCNASRDVKDVNHLADTLIELECCYLCGIDDLGICKLNKLKKLNSSWNEKIQNLEHLADILEVLICRGRCGIHQISVFKLKNVKILDCSGNPKIHDVNHMYGTLKVLKCKEGSNIDNSGILRLKNKLDKFVCDGNANFMIYLYQKKYLKKMDDRNNMIIENLYKIIEENGGKPYCNTIIGRMRQYTSFVKNKVCRKK